MLGSDDTGCLKQGRHAAGGATHTGARRARWSTARSACGWAIPVRWAMPCWIVSAIGPTSGPTTETAASRPGSRRTAPVPPHRHWLARGWRAPAPPVCPPDGSRGIACMGMTDACACGWQPIPKRMSWPSPARSPSGGAGDNVRSTRSWPPVGGQLGAAACGRWHERSTVV